MSTNESRLRSPIVWPQFTPPNLYEVLYDNYDAATDQCHNISHYLGPSVAGALFEVQQECDDGKCPSVRRRRRLNNNNTSGRLTWRPRVLKARSVFNFL